MSFDRSSKSTKRSVWWGATALGCFGIVASSMGVRGAPAFAFVAMVGLALPILVPPPRDLLRGVPTAARVTGAFAIAGMGLATAWLDGARGVPVFVGLGGVLAAALLSLLDAESAGTGAKKRPAGIASIQTPPERSLVGAGALRWVGAALVLAAAIALVAAILPSWSMLLAIAGGALLLLDAVEGIKRRSGTRDTRGAAEAAADPSAGAGWETVALVLILAAALAGALDYAGSQGWIPFSDLARTVAVGMAALSGLLAFAIIADPPLAPRWIRRAPGTSLDVIGHGAAAMAMLNILFLTLTILSYWSLKAIFAVLFLWQACVVAVEYRALRHGQRRRAVPPPIVEAPDEPITVIVPAMNEEEILPLSMRRNLAVPYPLRFIIVPAVKSTDRTVEVAERFARENPSRVTVVRGDTGSKARDLNKAWALAATPIVLLLDADETIDEPSLRQGLAILRADPDVGIVQGRKVSRAPDASRLARFINAERRYSTWLDHVLHSEAFGSGHFGGSAALIRREAPISLQGFSDRTLTEDIEFTLRVHLDGRWKIRYSPEMVVREADPRTFPDLLRQRTRWARGWAQCFNLFFLDVLRRRGALGRSRTFGLALLLLISVSSLWTTFVPATLVMRFAGVSPLIPVAIAIPLTFVMLPGRFLSYWFAARYDPVIPVRRTWGTYAELGLYAYLWILLGWFVQLHALYLELVRSPRVWHVTGKSAQQDISTVRATT
ncbi:MAG: glycosyltransferase family 2 protein [Thermoplasmatota archaeon]